MRQLDFSAPAMRTGPYLIFLRSSIGFSAMHPFDEWPFPTYACRNRLWGTDATITAAAQLSDFAAFGTIPDWAEFVEVVSITGEYGSLSDHPSDMPVFFNDPEYTPPAPRIWASRHRQSCHSDVQNLMDLRTGAPRQRLPVELRLVIILFSDGHEINARDSERLKTAMGRSAVAVWHGRDMIGIATSDERTPEQIAAGLRPRLAGMPLDDFGVFRIMGVAPEAGRPSPLQVFAETARAAGRQAPTPSGRKQRR